MLENKSDKWITQALPEKVDRILDDLRPGAAGSSIVQQWLASICDVSPYMLRVAQQYPDEISDLVESGQLEAAAQPLGLELLLAELQAHWKHCLHTLAGAAQTLDQRQTEAARQSVLRRFRHRHLFRILWQDLAHEAELMITLAELTTLADACIQTAEQWSRETLTQRYGEPLGGNGLPLRLIVLGMGKLGGNELNVSSDIDLICLYAEPGNTTGDERGKGVVDNQEFFRRQVQSLTRLLNSVTADGFAYRVDTRLRPFGESGPLVMNFDGLENYYLTQARDWERYAMIKARAITGDVDDIRELQALVTPFVYRRYLDYNAFESLRDLKRKIALSVRQKGLTDNIKLGAGGIREIEFIGQAFQLVRGGRDERLRCRSIVEVLKQIAHQRLLDEDQVRRLLAAYTFLRRVENAVQMMRDEQVHSLPVDELDRQRLLVMLDETDWQEFHSTLASHQQQVKDSFSNLFEVEETAVAREQSAIEEDDAQAPEAPDQLASRVVDTWRLLALPDTDTEQQCAVLSQCGFEASEELLSAIEGLSRGAFYQRLAAEGKQRVEAVVPMIMRLSLDTEDPSQTLLRCLLLVRAVAGRSAYLQMLRDQPAVLARLVNLFAESRWLAGFVVRQPMVIDELLTGPNRLVFPDREAIRARAMEQLEMLRHADLDVQMDSLRHFRQGREMRIASAQLDGTLTLMQVSDQLSWLAESLIEVVLELVRAPLVARHGEPCCRPGQEGDDGELVSTVGIVAYGKLGGLELGFGSDLDLVFLHDSRGRAQCTNGDRPIENSMFYARLAQKFVSFMSTKTPAGVLYEIDLRLRPNGSSGVLVTGIDAFANYQRGDAWTWEHQALMRARMVYGNELLRQRFAATRAAVLGQQRSADELRAAVGAMREKMRVHLGSNRSDSMHLKQDAGGVADIEFIVQFLVLAYSFDHPALLEYTDNVRVLDVVEQAQILSSEDVAVLRASYLALRERLHRQALQEASATVALDEELVQLREQVIRLRTKILGPVPVTGSESGKGSPPVPAAE